VTDALRATVRSAIEPVLAAATGTLQRDQVRNAVTAALGGPNASLLVAERNGVVMNATYDETGRLLNDVDSVTFAEHEVAVLGDLRVEIPGKLDA
jgi:hypothetical protein